MDRRRKAGLAGRPATWLRVTAAASSAALLGLLGMAGSASAAGTASTASTAGTASAAAGSTARTAEPESSACHLGNGQALAALERVRDALALRIKAELEAAAFEDQPVAAAGPQTLACQAIINSAALLARSV